MHEELVKSPNFCREFTESLTVAGKVVPDWLSWKLSGESEAMKSILDYIFTSWEDALDVCG